jgi:Putative zinc-finger
MNCNCTEKISSLIDGELSTSEERELEGHLLNCSECQTAKADFLSLRGQINDFPVPHSPMVQREALARILGTKKPSAKSGSLGWRWVLNPAFAAVACLVLVAAVIALVVYPRWKSNTIQNPEIADRRSPRSTASPGTGAGRVDNPRETERNDPPKKSQPSSNSDKKKAPVKKPAPVYGPQPDFITQQVPQAPSDTTTHVRSADAETMTAIHFQKSELLLRSFRNVRMNSQGSSAEIAYEKKRAQQLVYQNMILRREADASGDVQIASLLESLEPILIDIANLPDNPRKTDVRVIMDRVERKNIVALLQVNSTAMARALD